MECWQDLVFSRAEIWWIDGRVRTGRPVNEQPPGLFARHTVKFIVDNDDVDSDTVAESDMSLISRSFLHSVNDRVRKIQDQSSKMQHKTVTNILWYGECLCLRHWKYLYLCERITQKIYNPKIQEKISQRNRCSTYLKKLIAEQSDEIYGVNTINWGDSRSMRDIGETVMSHWTIRARMHRWDSDQTSEKQSQICTVFTENLEKNDQNQSLFNNTKNGIRLLPVLHGGIGKNWWSSLE